jgi:tRNA 2-selenouridine synthase SelU
MGRPKKPDSEKKVNVGLYLSPPQVKELKDIAEQEDRTVGYLTRAFYLRGVAAYRRDSKVNEPVSKRTTRRLGRRYSSPNHADENEQERKRS